MDRGEGRPAQPAKDGDQEDAGHRVEVEQHHRHLIIFSAMKSITISWGNDDRAFEPQCQDEALASLSGDWQ